MFNFSGYSCLYYEYTGTLSVAICLGQYHVNNEDTIIPEQLAANHSRRT